MRTIRIAILGIVSGLAASQAAAQQSVIIGGLIDQYVGFLQNSGEATRRTVLNNGGMSTSWFGFRGSEKLGSSLTAEFALNAFFLGDTGAAGRFGGDNLFSRDAFIAVSGDLGKLTLGRTSAPTFLPAVLFNPFGDSFQFSPLILHTYVPTGTPGARKWVANTASDSGWSNQLQYSTPTFNNFQLNFYYQPGEALNNNNRNVAINGFYNNGPLGLTMAVYKMQVSNPNSGLAILDSTAAPVNYASIDRQRGYFLGARYDAQVVKLFATYRNNDADTITGRQLSDHSYSLGMSMPARDGAILAGFADTRRSGNLLASDLKRTTLTVGYDYTFSKRTDWYSLVMSDRITAAPRATSLATGVRHRF
jgi:predicted porin